MKTSNLKYFALCASFGLLAGCASNHDMHGEFVFGQATEVNLAKQSIRPIDLPNSRGISGQSGERAVAAIDRLNAGEQPELSDVSASGVGSTASE